MTFYRHDGSAWAAITLHMHNGSLWGDENDELYAHDGSVWQLIQPTDVVPPPPDDFPPPFDLTVEDIGDNEVTVSWSLPSSTPTPTEVQFRILEISTVFDVFEYPATVASHMALEAATAYTFQVRLVHRTDGVADVFSTIAEITFTTTETEVPTGPFEDPDGTGGDSIFIPPVIGGSAFPGVPGDVDSTDCWWEWKIQTYLVLGGGWQDMDPAVEGAYAGSSTFDAFDISTLGPGAYRYCTREVCNSVPGDWNYGDPFVPGDWDDPCADSPVSFDFTNIGEGYPDAVFYIPQVCTPNVIHDAVSGDELTKGSGFSGTFITSDDPEGNWQIGSVLSFDDSAAQHSVIEGNLDGVAALIPGDFTVSFKLNIGTVPIASRVLLLSLGGNAIVFVAKPAAAGLGYSLSVETYTTAGPITLEALSPTAIFPDTDYRVTLRWDDDGPKELFIGSTQEALNLDGDSYAHATISDQIIGFLPPDARIWSLAGWDRLLTDAELEGTEGQLTFVDASVSVIGDNVTSIVANLATYVAGDVVFLHATWQSIFSNNSTATTPTGWTLVSTEHVVESDPTADSRQAVWYKVMTGAEGATVTIPFSAAVFGKATTYSFSGVKTSDVVDVFDSLTNISTSWTAPGLTTTEPKTMILVMRGAAGTSAVTDPSHGTVADKQTTEYLSILVTEIKTPAGSGGAASPGTVTLSSGGIRFFSHTIAIIAANP